MKKNLNPKITCALVAIVSLLFLNGIPSEALEPGKSPDVVYFHVRSACSQEKLSGVTISVIRYDGKQVEVGRGNESGLVVIERPRLEGSRLIMACAEDYFCAGIKNPRAQAGSEILILLAPFAMT